VAIWELMPYIDFSNLNFQKVFEKLISSCMENNSLYSFISLLFVVGEEFACDRNNKRGGLSGVHWYV
jgi:hypothetical protein